MDFEDFKELVSFEDNPRYQLDDGKIVVRFDARFVARCMRCMPLFVFNQNEDGAREYMHDQLAYQLYDMLKREFDGGGYSENDLRLAYGFGTHDGFYNSSFERALKEINRRKGRS